MASDDEENDDQGQGMLVIGPLADLSGLRIESTRSSAFAQRDVKVPDDLLIDALECQASIKMDDAPEDVPSKVSGLFFVTQAQAIFVADASPEHDIIIGATCIHLHAMTEDPELALYLQIGYPSDDNNADGTGGSGGEVNIYPNQDDQADPLFKALCKLVELHPIVDDEDDNNGGIMGGGGISAMMGGFNMNDFVWAGGEVKDGAMHAFQDTLGEDDAEGGASDTQRVAMLDRLDDMLVIPPEYEVLDGQFDDVDAGEGQFDDAEDEATS